MIWGIAEDEAAASPDLLAGLDQVCGYPTGFPLCAHTLYYAHMHCIQKPHSTEFAVYMYSQIARNDAWTISNIIPGVLTGISTILCVIVAQLTEMAVEEGTPPPRPAAGKPPAKAPKPMKKKTNAKVTFHAFT
eukprot:COSAG05_NODE_1809_length_4041_cov_4.735921_3_plen_133_part_00